MSSSTLSLKGVREITTPIIESMPESLRGMDYHAKLGVAVDSIDEDKRSELRKTVHSFLTYMKKTDASDIDLGGRGCDGKIWYRVFGKKKPIDLKDDLSYRETDVLLHNIITASQRKSLIEDRNLDFSYTVNRR